MSIHTINIITASPNRFSASHVDAGESTTFRSMHFYRLDKPVKFSSLFKAGALREPRLAPDTSDRINHLGLVFKGASRVVYQ